jgi:hypothetical protein
MKNLLNFFLVLFLSFGLFSCEVIGGIFEAGLWVGTIMVVLVIGVVIWVIRALFGRR